MQLSQKASHIPSNPLFVLPLYKEEVNHDPRFEKLSLRPKTKHHKKLIFERIGIQPWKQKNSTLKIFLTF